MISLHAFTYARPRTIDDIISIHAKTSEINAIAVLPCFDQKYDVHELIVPDVKQILDMAWEIQSGSLQTGNTYSFSTRQQRNSNGYTHVFRAQQLSEASVTVVHR